MDAEAKEQHVDVLDETATKMKPGSVHDSEAAKHHDAHAKNVSRTGHESVEVTWKTWFVIFLLSISYGLSFWPVPTTAQIQTKLVANFNDPDAAFWIIPVYTLTITMGYASVGIVGDLFGRRWITTMGNLVCFVGHIIIASSKSANQLIGGMAVVGFGGGAAQTAIIGIPELLPNRMRHIGIVLSDGLIFIILLIGPVVGRYSIQHGSAWRWMFYASGIGSALNFVALFVFYHPPKHPRGYTFKEAAKGMDYIGIGLFWAMCGLVLSGIVLTSYLPSTDKRVLVTLVLGFVVLIVFALWETFSKVKFKVAPPAIFARNYGRAYTMPFINTFIVGMTYYAINVTYPTMNSVLWSANSTNPNYSLALSLPPNIALVLGGVLLAVCGNSIRHYKWQLIISCTGMVLFGGLLALVQLDNMGTMIAISFLQQLFFGWAVYLGYVFAQLGVHQHELGVAGGLSGVCRYGGGSIAQAVYTTILTNTFTKEFPKKIPPAALGAGLPQSSLSSFLVAFPSDTTALASIPGVTQQVLAAAGLAYQESYLYPIRVTALTSIAFGAFAILSACLCLDIDHKMNNEINVFLENDRYAEQNEFHEMEKIK